MCAEQHHHSARKVTTEPVSAKDLQTWFIASNRAYFEGQLPLNTEVVWGDLTSQNDMGYITRRANKSWLIIIDRKTNPTSRSAYFTEYHEMCHLSLWNKEDEFGDHGPKFQSCMTQLALKGAFTDLW